MSSTSGISGSSQNQSVLLQLIQQLRQAQAQKTTASSGTGSTDAASDISRFFQTSDTDGNGELSQSELTSGLQQASSLLSGNNLLQASASTSGDTAQDAIKALIDSIKASLQSADSTSTDSTTTDPKTQFQQALFKQLDGNGDGSLTKSEVEGAVTKAGGTTAAADALYAKLDPNNTGTVSEQQFAANLPKPPHRHHAQSSDAGTGDTAFDAIKTLLDSVQSSSDSASNQSGDPATQFAQNLFKQLGGNSDGSVTKDEVESAVTKAGGTKESADALYAKLDPNNTGSVNQQQLAQNLPPPPPRGGGGGPGGAQQTSDSSSTSSSGSYDPLDTNQDGTVSLAERLAGLGISLDGSSSDSSTASTDTQNQQGLFAQLRSQTLNFLISLQSGSGNSAAA